MQSLQTRMNGVLLRSQADQAQLARERSADQERALQVEAELFMERRQQEEERNRDRLRQTTIAANTATSKPHLQAGGHPTPHSLPRVYCANPHSPHPGPDHFTPFLSPCRLATLR